MVEMLDDPRNDMARTLDYPSPRWPQGQDGHCGADGVDGQNVQIVVKYEWG